MTELRDEIDNVLCQSDLNHGQVKDKIIAIIERERKKGFEDGYALGNKDV